MEKKTNFIEMAGAMLPLFSFPPLEIVKRRLQRQMWLIALALLWALAIFIEGCGEGFGVGM